MRSPHKDLYCEICDEEKEEDQVIWHPRIGPVCRLCCSVLYERCWEDAILV